MFTTVNIEDIPEVKEYVNKRVVTKSAKGENGGYQIFADGYCEQWGVFGGHIGNYNVTNVNGTLWYTHYHLLNYHIPMTPTNGQLTLSSITFNQQGHNAIIIPQIVLRDINGNSSTTQFTIAFTSPHQTEWGVYWRINGYVV